MAGGQNTLMKKTMTKINAIIICLTMSCFVMPAEARTATPGKCRSLTGTTGLKESTVMSMLPKKLLPGRLLPGKPVLDTEEIILDGVSIDMVSGPTNEMPWENESEFIKARLRNGTNVILGGYRTVLKDPLPGEEYNVHLAASLLAGTVIKPGEVFSQNAAIGPYTQEKGFEKGPTYIGTTLTTTIGGGVCKIASTLYNVAVLSDLKIVERHNHTMPVPYVPYGQDATVSYGNKDIRFANNTGSDIMIWAQGIDNVLYMAFYGSKPAPEVEWKHEVLDVIKAPVQYKTNPGLGPDEQKLLLEGMDGAVVKSWVTVSTSNSSETRYMGISSYKPMPHLFERGPQ